MQPELEVEQVAPELIGTGAQAIVENAKRLGLTWSIRKAEVTVGSNPSAVLAVFDGDTEPVGMISLIGLLFATQRVWVIIVPSGGDNALSGGNYIIGFIGLSQFSALFRSNRVGDIESTANTAFVDLATVGPTVSNILIGSSGSALVTLSAMLSVNNAAFSALMGYAISGATTLAASANIHMLWATNPTAGAGVFDMVQMSYQGVHTGLTPGLNTFQCKYRALFGGGTAQFSNRTLSVLPL